VLICKKSATKEIPGLIISDEDQKETV
jgi:hypothetical protein